MLWPTTVAPKMSVPAILRMVQAISDEFEPKTVGVCAARNFYCNHHLQEGGSSRPALHDLRGRYA